MKLLLLFLSLLHFTTWAGDVTKGADVYQKCIACHGTDGWGKKSQRAPSLAGQFDWYIEAQIFAIKKEERKNNNTSKMLPFVKNLSDEDIKNVSAYISQMKEK